MIKNGRLPGAGIGSRDPTDHLKVSSFQKIASNRAPNMVEFIAAHTRSIGVLSKFHNAFRPYSRTFANFLA
jgi:hypothetical protein